MSMVRWETHLLQTSPPKHDVVRRTDILSPSCGRGRPCVDRVANRASLPDAYHTRLYDIILCYCVIRIAYNEHYFVMQSTS